MLIDDVGSFPLPINRRDMFERFYFTAYDFLRKHDVQRCLENRAFKNNFYQPVIDAFTKKLETGLDVINYPQLFSMHGQFLKPIMNFQEGGNHSPFLINSADALIPEIPVIKNFIEQCSFPELGIPPGSASSRQIQLKACITGPVELYMKTELGFTVYKDILMNIAKSINRFAKNSIISTERIQTKVIVIDEPSLGFVDLFNIEPEDITECLDVALDDLGDGIETQVHLHSLRDASIALNSHNIDVLTCEYASDRSNTIARELLEQHGKKMRVGICRTNLNAIIGRLYEKGIKVGSGLEEYRQLIDSETRIRENLESAIKQYGKENIAYIGPDCGLSSWRPPELAQILLQRVTKVAKAYLEKHG
ncbi:hypothetical protein GF325_01140 [Candidatus Bathyarchaeota archaeon]|nr:hypothetical protein [Candidatus Bathyarchaeota archaeon]